jgi:hypothetical protein
VDEGRWPEERAGVKGIAYLAEGKVVANKAAPPIADLDRIKPDWGILEWAHYQYIPMGVRVAMDDFGTGYSSLSYLKRFDIDTLKIDRSFVNELPHDPEDSAIATAIVAMGHSLHMKVVAEGVETLEQARFLREMGCDEMQGYLLSRPMPPDAFALWLDKRITGGQRSVPGYGYVDSEPMILMTIESFDDLR